MATRKSATKELAAGVQQSSGGALVDIKAQMAAQIAQMAGRLGAPGGDTISCTQDKFFKFPDGTKHPGPLSLVIVDFISANSFYDGPYDPNVINPPVCFAIGTDVSTMAPSKNSPQRQADSCAVCQMNQFGSDGKGKACKNTRVMAVLPPDAKADTPIMVLKTSPTAIKAFDAYVKSIVNTFGLAPVGVVTQISFDPTLAYGSLRFGNPTPNENLETIFPRQAEAMARLKVEPDVSAYDAPAPAKKSTAPTRRRT